MADNFRFDITGAPVRKSLEIALQGASGGKVVAWRVDEQEGRPRLILFWTPSDTSVPLPAPLSGEALFGFVESWLETATYGPEPNHDGSNGRGCRVYNEPWGRIGTEWQAFAAVEPAWLMYGK